MPDRCHQKLPWSDVMAAVAFHERSGSEIAFLAHLRHTHRGDGLERSVCPACGFARGGRLP